MSTKRSIIELHPESRVSREMYVSRGFRCPYCGGHGSLVGRYPEEEDIACPDCGGSGELMAMVTVEWKADGGREYVEQ
jgi:DnaJ-class molecular chaperone